MLSHGRLASLFALRRNATETGLAGWGGRIRTSEWRDQNPLPYHLATPQHFKAQSTQSAPRTQQLVHGRSIQTTSNVTRPAIRHARGDALGVNRGGTGREDTGTRSGKS